MPWQEDLKKIDDVFHQKLRTDATFEWLYVKTIEDAINSKEDPGELIDGLIQLGKHVSLHAQYSIAKKLFEKTLTLCEQTVGFNGIRAGKLCDNISFCLMVEGRYNEALSTIEKWVTATEGKLDKSQYDHREIMAHYAEVLYRAGKNVRAQEIVREVHQLTPDNDPLQAMLTDRLTRYETPCPTSFDPADLQEAAHLRHEVLHGSPASLESLRNAVLEIVVKQALAGVPWQERCKGAMEINGITVAEVEAEVNRRRAVAH